MLGVRVVDWESRPPTLAPSPRAYGDWDEGCGWSVLDYSATTVGLGADAGRKCV